MFLDFKMYIKPKCMIVGKKGLKKLKCFKDPRVIGELDSKSNNLH